MHALELRSVFLAGCITLAAPGLLLSSFTAVQAWNAWSSAQAAASGTQAAGEVMRTATLLMVERGRLQDAAIAADPKLAALTQAAAASDLALARAEHALRSAGLPLSAVDRGRTNLAAARNRAATAIEKRSALRVPVEQFNRLIEDLEEEVSHLERGITLANPSVGIAVGLARSANELRGIAGRRGIMLNTWFSGRDLSPSQKDDLLLITGRLAGAWERLQRGIRVVSLTSELAKIAAGTDHSFFVQREPWCRELVKAAVADAERPLTHSQYRRWHVQALDALLPLRDALVSEAAARSDAAIQTARRDLLAAMGVVLVSLGLVIGALLGLLRGFIEPVRRMTKAMNSLAMGNLAAEAPARSGLHEIDAMAGAVAIFRHAMTSLRRREAELRQTNLHFTAALENMSQGLAMYDAEERLTVFNRHFCDITGVPHEQVRLGMTYREVVALSVQIGNFPGMTAEQAYADRRSLIADRATGGHYEELRGERAIAARYQPRVDGGWVTTFEDVTERKKNEAQIAHMARHDALTGLPNRLVFRDRLNHELANAKQHGGSFAVLACDLDSFKAINDTLGHPAGDRLLCSVADRLRSVIRDSDTIARLGGDEFAIILERLEDPQTASLTAQRLIQAVGRHIDLNGEAVSIGVSIGIALGPQDGSDADTVFKNADIALYRAKGAGRNTYSFYEPGMDTAVAKRNLLERDLRDAIQQGGLVLHYQPVLNLASGELGGFEALVRWHHPARGLISPAEFIPLAEETGLIVALGEWALREACREAANWPTGLRVAVNVSAVQFQRPGLEQAVINALAASGLAPRRLELEITESVLVQDAVAAMACLHRLRTLGVRIALDDFGTGYSSLSYLRSFSFDKIKIDRSFIKEIADPDVATIVRAIVSIGRQLGTAITAEGVETPDQFDRVGQEGCTEVQGFL